MIKKPINKNKLRWLDYEYINRTVAWDAIAGFSTYIFTYVSQLKNVGIFKKVFMLTTILG